MGFEQLFTEYRQVTHAPNRVRARLICLSGYIEPIKHVTAPLFVAERLLYLASDAVAPVLPPCVRVETFLPPSCTRVES